MTAVGIGGALGAVVRWAVVSSVAPTRFPWPVLGVNVVGAVLLGALLAEEWARPRTRLLLHDAGGIGFCGGLTTFSTFALEVVDLARWGDAGSAAVYFVASVTATIAGVMAGAGVLRRVRSAILPMEGLP